MEKKQNKNNNIRKVAKNASYFLNLPKILKNKNQCNFFQFSNRQNSKLIFKIEFQIVKI